MVRPTLKDVAARAGVSVSTASYALNVASTLPLATATKDRVRRAALELGYVPNGLARSLQARASRTIGVILGKPVTMPRYAAIAEGISRGLRTEGFRLSLLGESDGSGGVADVRGGSLDGLVFIGHDDQGVPPELSHAVAEFGVPFVAIDCGQGESESSYATVDFDYARGMHESVAHLWAQGIRTIIYVRPGIDSPAETARARALARELGERPELDVQNVVTDVTAETIARLDAADDDRTRTHDALVAQVTESLTTFHGDPAKLAVLCAWGVDAEAAYRAAALHDSRVRVAALAAGALSVDLWPGLTYSRLPLEEGGREGARLIIAATREGATPEHVLLPPVLDRGH